MGVPAPGTTRIAAAELLHPVLLEVQHDTMSHVGQDGFRQPAPATSSNRRPSDYESDRNLPTGPAQHHPGCSGAGSIPASAVL